jgi:hypothetical protein
VNRRKLIGASFALFAAWPAEAALHLDQLSNCDSLGQVLLTLRSFPTDCRAPDGPIERSIAAFYVPQIAKTCFLARPPSAALSSFDCVVVQDPQSRQLACQRSARWSDILAYRQTYQETYAPRVRTYLDAAAACPQGNGDATTAVPTMLPFIVGVYAKYELGFALPRGGTGLVGESTFVHGYGSVDPDLIDSDHPAVEFFGTWVKR